jgi:hypothetical protein
MKNENNQNLKYRNFKFYDKIRRSVDRGVKTLMKVELSHLHICKDTLPQVRYKCDGRQCVELCYLQASDLFQIM